MHFDFVIDQAIREAKITQPRASFIATALEAFPAVIADGSLTMTRKEFNGGVDLVLEPSNERFKAVAAEMAEILNSPAPSADEMAFMRSLYPETRLRVVFDPFDVRVIAAPVPAPFMPWYLGTLQSFIIMADGFRRYALALEWRAQASH